MKAPLVFLAYMAALKPISHLNPVLFRDPRIKEPKDCPRGIVMVELRIIRRQRTAKGKL